MSSHSSTHNLQDLQDWVLIILIITQIIITTHYYSYHVFLWNSSWTQISALLATKFPGTSSTPSCCNRKDQDNIVTVTECLTILHNVHCCWTIYTLNPSLYHSSLMMYPWSSLIPPFWFDSHHNDKIFLKKQFFGFGFCILHTNHLSFPTIPARSPNSICQYSTWQHTVKILSTLSLIQLA